MSANDHPPLASAHELAGITGRVLVVDDNPTVRMLHRGLLAKQFEVAVAAGGHEAIAACREQLPDLILLDIEMPDLDGIETCRQLREWTDTPIIFATAHESLDEHMRAYDAGGNDIVVKPVANEILLRKVALAIRQHRTEAQLAEEKQSLQKMAMNFLSTMGENGALLNFTRGGVECRSHSALAQQLIATAQNLGVVASVMVRHEGGPTFITPHGDASPIEQAIHEQAAGMGRIFQFRRRLVVNYARVSIIVANMPDEETDAEAAGRVRDNVAILAEITEALCENVDMRLESTRRAELLQVALGGAVTAVEGLQAKYYGMLGDTRMLLQDLVDTVEKNYAWLGASQAQEVKISREMDRNVQQILALLAEGGDFAQQFSLVLAALRGGDGQTIIELY